jgi:hypothetical protein
MNIKGGARMSLEESRLPGYYLIEDALSRENLTIDNGVYPAREGETLEQCLFELALALATEPSKLAQLREMLAQLQATGAISEEFSICAARQIDEKLVAMALEYAHDAEILVQILSFKCSTLNILMHDIEDLYRREKISQRVYVRAKLLFME